MFLGTGLLTMLLLGAAQEPQETQEPPSGAA
jgi:hypothetical protein